MKVLLFNLKTDESDTTLGFTTSWVNALARHCDRVLVVTLRAGEAATADNVEVYSLGWDRVSSKTRRLVRFYRLVRRLVRGGSVDVCFAHMTPLLAILFAPFARLYRIPVLLWFAHGTTSTQLRLAHRLVDRCVTSTRAGFPLQSRKLYVLGQGIDTDLFAPPDTTAPDYARTLLSIARVSPSKRLDEIVEAVAALNRERLHRARLIVIGGALTSGDRAYEERLREQIRARGLEDTVSLEGAVPFHRVADVYRLGSVFVNVSVTGSLDKAILEAMSSGCVPVSRNRSFAAVARAEGLDWLVPEAGPAALAECIARVLDLPEAELDELRVRMRAIVVRDHSLDALGRHIAGHLRELTGD